MQAPIPAKEVACWTRVPGPRESSPGVGSSTVPRLGSAPKPWRAVKPCRGAGAVCHAWRQQARPDTVFRTGSTRIESPRRCRPSTNQRPWQLNPEPTEQTSISFQLQVKSWPSHSLLTTDLSHLCSAALDVVQGHQYLLPTMTSLAETIHHHFSPSHGSASASASASGSGPSSQPISFRNHNRHSSGPHRDEDEDRGAAASGEDEEDEEYSNVAAEEGAQEMVNEQTVKAGYLWKKGEKRKVSCWKDSGKVAAWTRR